MSGGHGGLRNCRGGVAPRVFVRERAWPSKQARGNIGAMLKEHQAHRSDIRSMGKCNLKANWFETDGRIKIKHVRLAKGAEGVCVLFPNGGRP